MRRKMPIRNAAVAAGVQSVVDRAFGEVARKPAARKRPRKMKGRCLRTLTGGQAIMIYKVCTVMARQWDMREDKMRACARAHFKVNDLFKIPSTRFGEVIQFLTDLRPADLRDQDSLRS